MSAEALQPSYATPSPPLPLLAASMPSVFQNTFAEPFLRFHAITLSPLC